MENVESQSWMPPRFEFPSGLPELKVRRKLLIVIQACIDESGVKGTDPFFVMAGFIAKAENWARFADEWSAFLEESPRIGYLKMNHAAKLDGQFRRWTAEQRDRKLRGLVNILKKCPSRAIHCSIDLAAYEARKFDGPMRDVYYFAFNTIITGICHDVIESGSADEIDLIFDQHMIFGPRVSLWYPAVKDALTTQDNPDFHDQARVMPPMPSFRVDEKFAPLQAADVLAWMLRNMWAGKRNQFEWIAEELSPVIPMSHLSSYFDAERLERIERMSYEMKFPEEHLRKWIGILGINSKRSKARKKGQR